MQRLCSLTKNIVMASLSRTRILPNSFMPQCRIILAPARFYGDEKNIGPKDKKSMAQESNIFDRKKYNNVIQFASVVDKEIFKCIDEKSVPRTFALLKKAREIYPEFHLNRPQVVGLARLMLSAELGWKAVFELFNDNIPKSAPFNNTKHVHQFVGEQTGKCDMDLFDRIVHTLIKCNILTLDDNIRGQYIENATKNNETEKALTMFNQYYAERNKTLGHIPIIAKLIEAGNETALDSVFEKVVKIHGDASAHFALAHAHIEVGDIENAREILKKKVINEKTFQKRVDYLGIIVNFRILEGFVEATRELHYDRSHLYNLLMAIYCKKGWTELAIGLLNKRLDENEIPSRKFCVTLDNHLEKINVARPEQLDKCLKSLSVL